MQAREPLIAGYVKVEIRSRLPKTWGWSILRDANGVVLRHSDEPFKCAEDAWQAGQAVLRTLAISADAA
ncbi:hypothetical protein [Falsiroseomonas sp. E2-1-a20]|uniref:hypothetical protein n=1 Tax=Falsiroseomonas sp. E2-1-a20 TaxID=3239300 RepID=UPI003F37990A